MSPQIRINPTEIKSPLQSGGDLVGDLNVNIYFFAQNIFSCLLRPRAIKIRTNEGFCLEKQTLFVMRRCIQLAKIAINVILLRG